MAEDKSGFGGKPYIDRDTLKSWLKGDEGYKALPHLPPEQREKLGDQILNSDKFGPLIEKGEPEAAIRALDSGEIPLPPGMSKDQAINLLKKFLGK